MNYATIKKHDVANGTGIRVSLFVSGCTHRCKGCFNSEAWDFQYGSAYTDETENEILQALAPSYIKGLSLLGGEPFEPQNQPALLKLCQRVKREFPDKTIWCYTGYDYEKDILAGKLGDPEITDALIHLIDVLVDGEFVEAKKDLKLRFKGSSNQRIIDVPESLQKDDLILWDATIAEWGN